MWRWRLRFPSVKWQRCFRSPKARPFGWPASEVRMARRARSWITRSRPSYANRPWARSRLFAMRGLAMAMEDGGREELAHAERHGHRRRCERMGTAREHERRQARCEVPGPDPEDRRREEAARCEDAECHDELPQRRQHPGDLGGHRLEYQREQRARHAGRDELLDRRPEHLLG